MPSAAAVRRDRASSVSLAIAGTGLVTLVAAVAYRFGYGLTADEPWMANTIHLPWRQIWGVLPAGNLPFAYAVLKLWTGIFGESEVALRGFSALAYAAAVVMTGHAARKAAGPGAAIAAALLLAASDRIGLEQAATAAPYALLACIASAALLQSISLLMAPDADRARRPRLALLALTHLIGLLTHPVYAVVVGASVIAGTVADRRIRTTTVLAPLVAAATYGVLCGRVLYQSLQLQPMAVMVAPSVDSIQHSYQILWGVGPGFLLAGAVLSVLLISWRETTTVARDRAMSWIAIVGVLAWVLPIVVSIWKPIFDPMRTPALLLPSTALGVAVVLSRLGNARIAVGLALCCVLAGVLRIVAMPKSDPYPSRASLAAILMQTHCGDRLIAPGDAAFLATYYFRQLHAPDCVSIVPFPRDITKWRGQLRDPIALKTLQEEAGTTAREAAASGTTWMLIQSRGETVEASRLIGSAVSRTLACQGGVALPGAFFDAVTRCVPPKR